MAQNIEGTCTDCKKAYADEFCLECEKHFCSKCKISHLKRKSNKKHHVDKIHKAVDKKPVCVAHSKEVVFYCGSCSLLVCPTCMLENHKRHDIEEIEKAISGKKDCMKNEIRNLESRKENVKQIIEDLNLLESVYKLDNAFIINLICKRSDSLKSIIDHRKDEMIKAINQEQEVQISRKGDATKKLQEIENMCQTQAERLENSLERVRGIDLLMSYVEWEEEIQKLQKREINDFKPFPPVRFVVPQKEDEKITELFGKLDIGHREVKQGDHVRVKSSVIEPVNGWGDVTHDSVGIVTGLCKDAVKVDFPEFVGWEGILSEIALVQSADDHT